MSPRPETADLARRIAAAAIRNGTDPADLARIHRRVSIAVIWRGFVDSMVNARRAVGQAQAATRGLGDALIEFEAIGEDYADAVRERGR